MKSIITTALIILAPFIAMATCEQDVINYVDADPDIELVYYSQYNPFMGLMTQLIITEWNGSSYDVICTSATVNNPAAVWCNVSDCLGL